MPLVELEVTPNRALGFWKISESAETLFREVQDFETIPSALTHPNKRLEFIAGRVLVSELMTGLGIEFQGIEKNKFGKPFLKNHGHQLSLSHSYPYVAALIDRDKPVGVDLEQVKEKLLRIAPRVLDAGEFADAGGNLTKLCIYWCAKEAMLKVHGEKNLIFSKNLLIKPFLLQHEGNLIGRIIVGDQETTLSLRYRIMNDFAIVYNT